MDEQRPEEASADTIAVVVRVRQADGPKCLSVRRSDGQEQVVVQGSTETTFYVLAVYFGAVGIQRARHAVGCALVADFAGIVAAIGVCYWFFG